MKAGKAQVFLLSAPSSQPAPRAPGAYTLHGFLIPYTGVPPYPDETRLAFNISVCSGNHGSFSLLLLKYFSCFSSLDNCSFSLYFYQRSENVNIAFLSELLGE